MHVPTGLVRRRAQDADQVLAQEALQVRAQIADQEFGRRCVRTQPHAAGVQIHADVIEPFLPDHGVQFQGIQQDLHAVRQLQRLAAFQIDQPQHPLAVLARQHRDQIGMVVADRDQLRVDPVLVVERARQAERRLIDHRPGLCRAQQLQCLLPIESPRMARPFAGRHQHVDSGVLLQDRLLPRVAAVQQRPDQRAMIELDLRQSFLPPQFRTGGQKTQEPFAVVKEVPGDRGRTGAKRRVGHDVGPCVRTNGRKNRIPADEP